MLRLAVRTVRFRPGMFLAAFLAMFAAAVIMMACGGLIETGVRTAVKPGQLAGADVVIAGDQEYHGTGADPDDPASFSERVRIDAGLAASIAALPGVQSTTSYIFEGVPAEGTVDAIGVVAEPGLLVSVLQGRIDAQLDSGAVTLVGDERGRAELRGAKESAITVIALAGTFTAFAILVSIFGVASMLSLSISQRMQDLALLRAVGATPRQVRRLIRRETLLLSLIATALAVFPGQMLGKFGFDLLAGKGVVAPGVVFRQGWIPIVSAIAFAVAAALGGAMGAGRRASRIKPTQALAEVTLEGKVIGVWRMALAVIFLAGGAGLTVVSAIVMSGPLTPSTAIPAVLFLAAGVALMAPVLVKVATFAAQWPVRALGGVAGQLAVLNARGRSARMATVVGPVILLTAVSTGLIYLQTTNDEADRQSFSGTLTADAVVTSSIGFDPDLVRQLTAMPGVAGASESVSSLGFIENPTDNEPMSGGWNLLGVTALGAEATTPVAIRDGSLADLDGDTVAIDAEQARRLGVGLGDEITVRMGDDRTLDLRVVALFSAPTDFDSLLLPADTLVSHTSTGVATRIVVKSDGAVDPGQLITDLNEVLPDQDGLTVQGRDVLFQEFDDQKQTAAFATYLLVLMISGFSVITVANTLASSIFARRREFGLQRLAGSTRSQVLRMVALEGVIVAGGGLAWGTIAAAGIVVPVSLKRLDTPMPAGSPWIVVAAATLTVVLILVSVLLPACLATRGRPAKSALAME